MFEKFVYCLRKCWRKTILKKKDIEDILYIV
jgi:hypothetical protein